MTRQENKIGVLYTDYTESEQYHLQLKNVIVRDVFVHDRRADGDIYIMLFTMMQRIGIDRLWVHPECQLSIWLQAKDFTLIKGLEWFSPKIEGNTRPYGIRLGYDTYIFFPAYGEYIRKHRNVDNWDMATPQRLYNTVDYIERAIDHTFLWTPGATSIEVLREENQSLKWEIEPFIPTPLWNVAEKKMLARPMWQHRLPNGKRGLADEQKNSAFLIGYDKNSQYLGACINLELGNGQPVELDDCFHWYEKHNAFWQYTLKDVYHSAFNGYGLYCPLSVRDTWASTELLEFAMRQGIEFTIERGLVWETSAGKPMEKWARRLWHGKQQLVEQIPNLEFLATCNAQDTVKKMYLDMIGRLCAEYSKEYYHKDWNRQIVHRAIANQGYTILKRVREQNIKPVLVVNDSFYILTNMNDPAAAYPGILDYSQELRGYKCIGVVPMNEEIVSAFETQKAMDLEATIKRNMKVKA